MNLHGNGTFGRVVADNGAISAGGAKRYYIPDLLGSVRAVVDETGDVKENRDYDPWGVPIDQREYVSGDKALEQFSGQELDNQTGWYHFGQRDLMAIYGRWPSPDRFADKYPSHSPYSYTLNDPVGFIDVNGDSLWVTIDENSITIHYEGKLYNQSGKNINLQKAASDITKQIEKSFSGVLADGSTIKTKVNLTVAESMDDVSESDHLIVIDNVKSGTDGKGRGSTDFYGQKISYVDAGDFYHDYNPLGTIFSNNVRTTVHEIGHQMGLDDVDSVLKHNLMAQGRSGTQVSLHQLLLVEQNFNHGLLNRGSNRLNRGPFPPLWRR